MISNLFSFYAAKETGLISEKCGCASRSSRFSLPNTDYSNGRVIPSTGTRSGHETTQERGSVLYGKSMLGWIFPLSGSESRALLRVVPIPCQVFATQREWDKRADSCTGERITISAAVAASVPLCSHSESSLLLLIVNDFFKCEAGALAFPPCAFPPHSKM